jgi:hypothetical protein
MLVDQLAERTAHLFFDGARLVDVAGDAEQLGAGVVRTAEGRQTIRRRGAGWSAQRQSIPRCSPSSGSHRDPHWPGMAASGAAGPSCLPGFPAARFPRRRCRRRRRDGRRCRNPSRSCCSCRSAWPHRPGRRRLQALALADELAAHVDVAGIAPMAKPAIRQPSISVCGSWRRISRSLQVPGSDSSALTTR